MTTSLPSYGMPVLIPEIISQGEKMNGTSVRVVGRVDHFDAVNCLALLSEPTKPVTADTSRKLVVNTEVAEESHFRLRSQIMLIGELEKCDGSNLNMGRGNLILKARVARCVDRMDYHLYCKSVEVWKGYNDVHV